MGEPLMVNPNSYERVHHVLNSIMTARHPQQQWSMVGCDGVPYMLAHKLRDQNPELHDILMWPGQGNFEINFVKLLFKLLWPVGLESLATMVGYNSPKALQYAFQAANHHKSWELLQLYFQCFVQRQISDYEKTTVAPSATDFCHWISVQPNPTYRYIYTMVFRYLIALFMFRQGMREGKPSLLLGGRFIVAELFYTNNSRIYMEVNFRDIMTRLKAPTEVLQALQGNGTFSQTGNLNRREGGDFVLEGQNRKIKMFAPPGLPTHQQWKSICRFLDPLYKVRPLM